MDWRFIAVSFTLLGVLSADVSSAGHVGKSLVELRLGLKIVY